MKHKRRASRETAFALLFEWGFQEDESLDNLILQSEESRQVQMDPFALELASKTVTNRELMDQMIGEYSKNWKINRIPKVTLAVLRMSFCELALMKDIPVGATINEAVELVKKYATEEDAAYVNGLLGQYERDRTGVSKESVESMSMPEEAAAAPVESAEQAEE